MKRRETMKVKAQDSISARELWRDMLQFLRQARLPYLLIVLATVIALARSKIALLIPSYMQQFYAGDFSTHIILLLIGTGILRYVISMVVDWINRLCAARITRNIRKSLVSRLFRMPVAFYEKNTPKSLISRTTDDTTKMCIQRILSASAPALVCASASISSVQSMAVT